MPLSIFPRPCFSLGIALLFALTTGLPIVRAQNSSPAPSPTPRFEQPAPPYPEAALPARDAGTVTLRVTYSKEGLPQNVEIVNSSGSPLLDKSAADFVRSHWRSHGLSAVLTHDTKVNFHPPDDQTAPVSFSDFPADAPVEMRKNALFWRAVPTLTSLLIDQKSDGAPGRAREAVQVFAKLDPRDFSAPISMLQSVLSNFQTIAETNEVGIVVARNDGEEPNVLNVSVPPERVPGIVLLLQKTIAAAAADLRANAVSLNPPFTSAETATLAAALRKLEADAAALVAKSPMRSPAAASPSPSPARH